ncbi:MAG: VIT1/CCC1 transporter family protein [Chloroflexi bacterium]|nr:VIT1/CCC1 transporter family protein [Chloroflexota bacterium]
MTDQERDRPAASSGSSHRHWTVAPEPNRARHGPALRAGVLGASDGLVSNLSLVMGVAGSGVAGNVVIIAGLAGLVAGALSMGLGEYLSVQSSRELFAHELEIEAHELATNPAAEVDELCAIYERKGIPTDQAHALAERIVRGNPAFALDTMAREELGIDPGQLGGSAWVAAGTSLVLFAVGALIPLLPFVLLGSSAAVAVAAAVSGVALFGLGAAITNLTGMNPIRAGLRQLAFGAAAATVTYGIGAAIGGLVR